MPASFAFLYYYLRFALRQFLLKRLQPATVSLPSGGLADSLRSRTELIAENALLRQQLIIVKRSVKRPTLRKRDKFLLIVLASKLRSWKQALLIIQPDAYPIPVARFCPLRFINSFALLRLIRKPGNSKSMQCSTTEGSQCF